LGAEGWLATGGDPMNELQRAAYAHPVADPEQAQNGRHFRRFDLEHAVGLTANK
jgi:hypothetical protein